MIIGLFFFIHLCKVFTLNGKHYNLDYKQISKHTHNKTIYTNKFVKIV